MYGPLNATLQCIFSVSDHYMIKPQPILRKSIQSSALRRSDSRDSYTDFVRPRQIKGREDKLLKPDFIVVKVNVDVQANDPTLLDRGRSDGNEFDTIVLIVEAKKDATDYAMPWFQLKKYLKRCHQKRRVRPLYAMLTLGNESYAVQYWSEKGEIEFDDVEMHVTSSADLRRWLRDTVAVHGNSLGLIDEAH